MRVVLELCERALGVGAPGEAMRGLGRRAPGVVERGAHRVILAIDRASERLERRRPASRRLQPWLDVLANRAAGWSHMWNSVFPPAAYLAVPSGDIAEPAGASVTSR